MSSTPSSAVGAAVVVAVDVAEVGRAVAVGVDRIGSPSRRRRPRGSPGCRRRRCRRPDSRACRRRRCRRRVARPRRRRRSSRRRHRRRRRSSSSPPPASKDRRRPRRCRASTDGPSFMRARRTKRHAKRASSVRGPRCDVYACGTSCVGRCEQRSLRSADHLRLSSVRMRRRMGTLLLIRHGQASYGEADYDRLSTRGQRAGAALGRFLASARVDHVFVGPLRRHQQTLAAAVEAAGNLPRRDRPSTSSPSTRRSSCCSTSCRGSSPRIRSSQSSTKTPTRELANDAFHTMLGKWARDEWRVEGVERVEAFADRVRRGLDQICASVKCGATAAVSSPRPDRSASRSGSTFGASPHHMVRTSIVIRNASISELKFRSHEFDWHPERVSLDLVQRDPPPATRAAHGVLRWTSTSPESVRPLLDKIETLHRRRRDARRARRARARVHRRGAAARRAARQVQGRRAVGPAAAEGPRRPRPRRSSSTAWSPSGSAARRSATTCSAARRPTPATWRSSTSTARPSRRSAGSSRSRAASIRCCFSMTEPENPGSNPTLHVVHGASATATTTSSTATSGSRARADGAAFAIVMAVTNPEAPPHARASMIIVPTDTPGFELVRNIPIMGDAGEAWASHAEIRYRNVRVPVENRLGAEGAGFLIAQERLGPGRIHHCMRWIGICERAFDPMCRRIAHAQDRRREDARDAPDRAGVDRRGARRDRRVAPDGAARGVDDRAQGLPGRARARSR